MHVGNGIRDAWHGVQFYDDDTQLAASVAEYLAAGFQTGDALIVVATADHSRAFRARLELKGHDLASAEARGQLTVLDAHETLSRLLRDGQPDEALFQAAIEPILSRAGDSGARVRIYGEMVDLLWRDGNRRAAISLEQLWNELHTSEPFWLLCSYQRSSPRRTGSAVRDICLAHTHVIQLRPAETTQCV